MANQILSDRYPNAPVARRWQIIAAVTAIAARLRILAPYAVIELLVPGGTLFALLLWFYRRHKGTCVAR